MNFLNDLDSEKNEVYFLAYYILNYKNYEEKNDIEQETSLFRFTYKTNYNFKNCFDNYPRLIPKFDILYSDRDNFCTVENF